MSVCLFPFKRKQEIIIPEIQINVLLKWAKIRDLQMAVRHQNIFQKENNIR